jgi:hypothetical protein
MERLTKAQQKLVNKIKESEEGYIAYYDAAMFSSRTPDSLVERGVLRKESRTYPIDFCKGCGEAYNWNTEDVLLLNELEVKDVNDK